MKYFDTALRALLAVAAVAAIAIVATGWALGERVHYATHFLR